ncbi:MAG: hypothetical protein ACTHN5_20755 [Phycisphaerae bacterium]
MPFMAFDYLSLIMHLAGLLVSVMTFWRAGAMEEATERRLSVIWSGLSAVVYLGSWLILGMGWPGIIGGQVLLLVAIGVVRGIAYLREGQE